MHRTVVVRSPRASSRPIACIRCVLPRPTPPYRNSGLKPGLDGRSATLLAQACANSFGLPTTKLSKLKRGSSGAASSPRAMPGSAGGAAWPGLTPPADATTTTGALPAGNRMIRCGRTLARLLGRQLQFHPADVRDLGMPERAQTVAILASNPVTQEARRQQQGDLVCLDLAEPDLAQPGAVLDLAHLDLHARTDASPMPLEWMSALAPGQAGAVVRLGSVAVVTVAVGDVVNDELGGCSDPLIALVHSHQTCSRITVTVSPGRDACSSGRQAAGPTPTARQPPAPR